MPRSRIRGQRTTSDEMRRRLVGVPVQLFTAFLEMRMG